MANPMWKLLFLLIAVVPWCENCSPKTDGRVVCSGHLDEPRIPETNPAAVEQEPAITLNNRTDEVDDQEGDDEVLEESSATASGTNLKPNPTRKPRACTLKPDTSPSALWVDHQLGHQVSQLIEEQRGVCHKGEQPKDLEYTCVFEREHRFFSGKLHRSPAQSLCVESSQSAKGSRYL